MCIRDRDTSITPGASFTPDPSITPGPSITPAPGIPEDAEAWMVNPDDPTQVIAGKLEDLIRDFDANTEATIFIRSEEVLRVKDKTCLLYTSRCV